MPTYPTCQLAPLSPNADIYSIYQKFGNAREKRREAYVKSQFSPRSQKIGFNTEGIEIFFGSSHNGWLLPEFFSDFYTYGEGIFKWI
jgi:hypothetical protein